jgi:hypothetical protein
LLSKLVLVGEPASTGGLLQLGTGRLDEKEDDLVKSERTAEWVTGHDNSRAAMPFTAVIESELNFGAHPKRPLREEAHSLGRPMNLILNQVD